MATVNLYSFPALPTIKPPLQPTSTTGLSSSRSKFKPSYHHPKRKPSQLRIRKGTCRAEWSSDAPFTVAIGACMLSSLVLPITTSPDDDTDSAIDSTDSRMAVMGIISFIPYFNWLSWVFAWLDTGKRRYAIYSLVYLAPYLRYNMSLSPGESWLPIASIIFCIIHIQLEASIRNGDLQGFQLFSNAAKEFSSMIKEKSSHFKGHRGSSKEEGRRDEKMNLSSGEESENEIRQREVPKKPDKDPGHTKNGDWD